MNLVLIGYRGTGKSHVGFLLGKQLEMNLISLDAEIVKTAGMAIPQLVERYGWDDFRDRETAEVHKAAANDGLLIDCGGGVIERPENIEILRQNGLIFWLKASCETIVGRIENSTERPALVDGKTFTEEVAEVLERRTPKYAQAADHQIDTDGSTVPQVVAQIVALWKKR
ncbi:MAG: shikimate kinase [Desulfuromonas sp.]|nr:MAG: shikimate kinase [Desulfuromonas sp.]